MSEVDPKNVVTFKPRENATVISGSERTDVVTPFRFKEQEPHRALDVGDELIDTEKLYPIKNRYTERLTKLKTLSSEAVNLLELALDYYAEDERIKSDVHIQKTLAVIFEIFCLREKNEGITLISSCLYNSIRNLDGIPPNDFQIMALKMPLYRMANEPFMSFEKALDIVDHYLEQNGFNTDPEETALALIELLEPEIDMDEGEAENV